MKITRFNHTYLITDEPNLLKPLLSYNKQRWFKQGYRKIKTEYPHYLIYKDGTFLSGFENKVIQFCKNQNIPCEIEEPIKINIKIKKPSFPKEIKPLQEQLDSINIAISKRRGVIKAPTGYGKTVIACGIISCFPKSKILFLCHTKSLIKQTEKEMRQFGFEDISFVTEGYIDLTGRIIISTIQTFVKMDPFNYCDLFDVVIVDEAHHISDLEGSYGQVLQSLLSPMKFGLTATLPSTIASQLALEGLIGNVIGEITLSHGINTEFLAQPKIKLIAVPKNEEIQNYHRYSDIYDCGIVNYRLRNRLIIKTIISLMKEDKSCIVYINKIDHGTNLMEIALLMGVKDICFIRGETTAIDREYVREELQKKIIKAVIATTVWKEGVNVKSVDAIIIAGGGKSELTLLQSLGRGLRRDINKSEVLIIDFLDSGKYLSEHCIERIKVYNEYGWI